MTNQKEMGIELIMDWWQAEQNTDVTEYPEWPIHDLDHEGNQSCSS
jgi:hypothetical protein